MHGRKTRMTAAQTNDNADATMEYQIIDLRTTEKPRGGVLVGAVRRQPVGEPAASAPGADPNALISAVTRRLTPLGSPIGASPLNGSISTKHICR